MFKKGSKLYSIFTGTCPRCQNESMYTNKNPYKLAEVLDINESCSHCQLTYRMEPSFFYGAMYVSYAVGIAFAVAAGSISYFIFKVSINMLFVAIIGTLIVFAPIIMRLSRNIWINIFVHYDKNYANK